LEEVTAETPYFDVVVPLSGGFAGASLDRVVVDDGQGHRAFPAVAGRAGKGLAALGDGVVSAGFEGLVALDRQGNELARADVASIAGAPLAFVWHVLVPTREALVVLDENLQSQRRIDLEDISGDRAVVARGADVLVADDAAVRCVALEDGA